MLTPTLAASLAQLPLAGLLRELPHKLDHLIDDLAELRSPKSLHPAFYGCLDWHSAVHGHWTLVRLLRRCPALACAGAIRATLATTLTPANLAAEVAYFAPAARASFERPYGWAWLLALAAELHAWDDDDGRAWATALQPLAEMIAQRCHAFLPKQTYPIRTGVHANTAFALGLVLDYARTVGDTALAALIVERTHSYYGADRDYPAAFEPGGEDFLSPALVEADLMRRVLAPADFAPWLDAFLPRGLPPALRAPAVVSDRSDPKLAHLDGLNLSRAWCLHAIARALSPSHAQHAAFADAAEVHTRAGLAHVATGDYMGEHWLATFATYLATI